MQLVNFLYFLKKTWTIICHFWNLFPLSKIMDYHMQFMEIFSFLKTCGLSYAIFETFFTSHKTWTIICNLWYFFPFSKTWTIICNFGNFFLLFETWTIICNLWYLFPFYKNMDYHMQFLKFL